MAQFKVKGEWRTENFGHVYTAKAVTETGRILAVVNIEVPLDVQMDIRDRFGAEWVKQVEQAAQNQVTQAAEGWNHPTQAA
ncbi:MAG: hypothetical protein ABSB42_17630 [Tepidisphaeraceae bacterium]|jgi:hypothetical protein